MFSPVFLCQSRERLSRERGDVQWCSLGTAPFINKRSEPGFCCLYVWVVVLGRRLLAAHWLLSSWACQLMIGQPASLLLMLAGLLCPLLDCFAWSSSSSGALLWSALFSEARQSEVRDAEVSGLSPLCRCCLAYVASPQPSLLPAGLSISLFLPFSCSDGCP